MRAFFIVLCSLLASHASSATPQSQLPLPIHIPKTGGTAIEAWLAKNNIVAGFEHVLQHKDTNTWPKKRTGIVSCDFGKWNHFCCSNWHVPTQPKLNNITGPFFTIIRDPVERMQSQITYRGVPCHDADRYVVNSLRDFEHDNKTQDCHFLPQHKYVEEADETVISNLDIFCYHDARLTEKINALFPSSFVPFNAHHKDHKHCQLKAKTLLLIESVYYKDRLMYDALCNKL